MIVFPHFVVTQRAGVLPVLHWTLACGHATSTHASYLCPFQMVSASSEEPAVAADGGGGTAGVSEHYAGMGGRGLGQTKVVWKVRSDEGDVCDPGPHSDDLKAC